MVTVCIELFGTARIACGKRLVEIKLPERASIQDLTSRLSIECPELLGAALTKDGTELMKSYILNLNGNEFISRDEFDLKQGDRLLLFSSQAGG